MYSVHLLDNESGQRFVKMFDSEYLMNKFVNKCKRGKKIHVVAIIKNC